MNIHDVVRATSVAESVLASETALTPAQRMELCAKFQLALIDAETEGVPTVQPLASREVEGMKLTAYTPRGAEMLAELERVMAINAPIIDAINRELGRS